MTDDPRRLTDAEWRERLHHRLRTEEMATRSHIALATLPLLALVPFVLLARRGWPAAVKRVGSLGVAVMLALKSVRRWRRSRFRYWFTLDASTADDLGRD